MMFVHSRLHRALLLGAQGGMLEVQAVAGCNIV
jgi:hypothetical protein